MIFGREYHDMPPRRGDHLLQANGPCGSRAWRDDRSEDHLVKHASVDCW